jgi:hypothetical protein
MARCRQRKANGERCRAPEAFVDESGFCPPHRADGREVMAERGRCGAEVSKQVRRKGSGLRPGELPELRTPHDAQRVLDIVAHAAAEGRLPQRQADATTRAVREWLRAYEAGAVTDQVEELRRRLSELRGDKLEVLK